MLTLDDSRGFPSVTHDFGRLALQVPPKPPNRLVHRMGMVADSILTPREAKGGGGSNGSKRNVPWFRAETPPERRVPLVRQQSLRWMRNLDVQQERKSLTQLNPVKHQAATWPCDRDVGSKEGTASMGSLKVFEAKKHCTEVRRLVQAEHLEVMMARAHAAANGTHEVVDTVESLLQLGLTEFEASMDQFECADRSLARLRQAATNRPPELNYQPEVTEAVFNLLRDRYYYNRSKDMAKLLSVVDVDRSQDTFANGGPVTNRVKKDPLQGLDYEFDIVGLPCSPMGFTVLRFCQPPQLPQPLPEISANVAVHLSQDDADTRVFDFLSEDLTPTATKRQAMLDEKLGMGREGKTLKKSLTLSDRDRFRKKSLWIATEEDYHSRSQPDYSIEMTEPLPAHALESSQYASGGIGVFLTQQGSPVLRDLVDRPGAGGQVKESNSSAHKKQATQVQGRGDVGFMSSHPFNAAASTQPRAGQHVERAGLFMRSSNKYAPNGELSKKLGSQRNSISVTSLSVLNHTV